MNARDLALLSSRTDGGAIAAPSLGLTAKYQSLFVIGRGGMGSVEAALELDTSDQGERTFRRVVALKRLLPDSARDRRRVEMFLREARLATMLDHPNIVRALDYGEVDGELFLALEYIEGQPLSRVLRALSESGGEFGTALTAFVMAQVCEGLHAAHELRDGSGAALALVHRDVSPQNVMLGYDGSVRLLDFGVAKINTESATKTGEVKGKTAYMSPEQAMGDAVDRRSDLFSVGALIFECITLRRMWGDGTDMDVIRKLALELPPQLDTAKHGAPAELVALHSGLVARSVAERPASALEVATRLRALVPQDLDAAASLRELLAERFGDQAAEWRERLTASLEEITPDHARELRDSLPSRRPSNGVATVAHGRPRSRGRRSLPWLLSGALALAGLGAWRAATSARTAPASSTPSSTSRSSTSETAPSISSTPAPTSSVALTATARTSETAISTSAAPSRRRPASLAAPPTGARPPLAPPAASTVPVAATPSAKPPAPVDDHPF